MAELPLISRAKQHASAVAIRARTRSFLYSECLSRSASVAARLLSGSNDPGGARVACLVPAGFDYVTTQWGIWRVGGIAVPLSLSATESELEYALTDSQVSSVIVARELAGKLSTLCDRLSLRMLVAEECPASSVDATALPQVDIDRRAMILYTSGTTSRPKGVVTTHANIQAQIESLVKAWRWTSNDRIPLFLPLHHIHGIINIQSCALWSGASIEPFRGFDRDVILARVLADAYTVFMAVPTVYVKLIEVLESMSEDDRFAFRKAFGRMRLMISGSAALPASIHEKWTSLTGQKLLERYGMTEIGMGLSNPYDGERRPGAVGQPLPGVEVRLRTDSGEFLTVKDVESGESEPGEIQVRGPVVFQEYWNRPDATKNSFEDGWFRTGDVAVIEDGYFRIMGRQSVDIIKSGGYKLSALEIEAALLQHPHITECAVVGVPDDMWGETVSAAVVVDSGQPLTLDDLREWCRDRISDYRIPRALRVVDELPRNAMGKVTKPAVRNLFLD